MGVCAMGKHAYGFIACVLDGGEQALQAHWQQWDHLRGSMVKWEGAMENSVVCVAYCSIPILSNLFL